MSNYALYSAPNNGTPMMLFSLEMALAPGMGESTQLRQLSVALAYWQGHSTQPYAATAITWIQTELTRVQSPPANALHTVIPK